MDLMTTTQAIEKIKSAKPGDTFHIGLYKNANFEPDYNKLSVLLGCQNDIEIFDGPYKVYSGVTPAEEAVAATGWISPNIYYHYHTHLANYGDIPLIGGLMVYPDNYDTFEKFINALDSTTRRAGASIAYSAEKDKIIVTALEAGEAGNSITLKVEYGDNWPAEYGLKCSESGSLTGGKERVESFNTVASHVWIKNTQIPYVEETEDEETTTISEATIKMWVKPGIENYPLTLDFTQRWKFDEYDENNILPTIDWGDGIIEEIIDIENITHSYSEPGEYEITMYDIHWCGWSGNGAPSEKAMPVTEIKFIKPQVVSAPSNSFRSLEILKKVSGKIYTAHSYRSSAGHNYMFLYDAELDDLSELTIHFGPGPDGNGITTLNSIFWGCSKVTSDVLDKLTIEHYNKNLITSSQYLFNNANVSSIDNSLLGSNLISGQYVYSHCSSLTHLTGGILDNLVSGQHMFENTSIRSCDKDFGLPSLVNGDCMFFGTELPYRVIEQIYNSLTPAPEDVDYGIGSNNEPENYSITFGYNIDEENIIEKLSKLLNIDIDKWSSGLPMWIFGQYDNSNDKRWYISFTNRNNVN